MIKEQIAVMKQARKIKLDVCSAEIRLYVKTYGAVDCSQLKQLRDLEIYHRGAWNALTELEWSI